MHYELKMTAAQHALVQQHLFPGDGLEAVAVALCGRHHDGQKSILLVHDITLIPHNECVREPMFVNWPTTRIHPYFQRLAQADMAIVKIHCHPGGFTEFSDIDDSSDYEFFGSVFGWATGDKPHGSMIMMPDGSLFGRVFHPDLTACAVDRITVVGDYIRYFGLASDGIVESFAERTAQAFGPATYNILKKLTIGVVGCSGTGSPVVEQIVRLGAGQIVLVDPDIVEAKNLNRILHSTKAAAEAGLPKVEVMQCAIENMGLETGVTVFQKNLYDSIEALRALCKCDVIFGCMDSVDGRYLLNQLCTFYLIPYFDLGVKLEADGTGGINKVCGSVHYLQPGKSSLLGRGMFSMPEVTAAGQLRRNPEEYKKLQREAYIKNVNVNNPAVISVNMQIASHAINEFLNRLHRYKGDEASAYAVSVIDITENCIVNTDESDLIPDAYLAARTGRGDMAPFIEIPEIIA
ncbi:MAG: HesA/MoeB/ThiF family protein [Flavisolibacter sp.]